MEKMSGYSLVAGDGGRASSSGLIRQRIAEEGDNCGFLELSLGSIYNNKPSADDHHGFVSPVARTLLPTTTTAAAVAAAPTASYAPPPAFALGLGRSAATAADGNGGGGPVVVLTAANNALLPAVAIHHGHHQVAPALFARGGGIGAVPVPAPVSTAPAVPRPKGAVAALLGAAPAPPPSPPNRKAPRARGRRSNSATGTAAGRHRSGDDGDAAAPPSENAPPPFPWASETAGTHPTLAELFGRGIVSVDGDVRCKRCDASKTISYGIGSKFEELSAFVIGNMETMNDRAPPEWMYPVLPDCDKCGQKNSLRPVIAAEKSGINWMFLLLGQTLGLCTLDQLKHFCAKTRQHRTGAKDRVLYSTYMELCNQLCPGGPFDMASERKNRVRPFAT